MAVGNRQLSAVGNQEGIVKRKPLYRSPIANIVGNRGVFAM